MGGEMETMVGATERIDRGMFWCRQGAMKTCYHEGCCDLLVSDTIAALGSLGGKAGTGEAKRRGDSAYYKALRAKRNPHTYGKGTMLSSAYTKGRDGLPMPKNISRGSAAHVAWKRGALERTAELLKG